MSRKKYKSWESSCNSSGYDYPEYLIQFPQTTIGDDLKNAMGLNNNQTKYSHKSNLSSRIDSNSMVDKLSCDDISTREITTDKTSILDIFNSEITSNKQNGSKNPQQRQKCHDSNSIFDELSYFHDVSQNAVVTSSQFYKLEMKKKSNYQKNKKITSTTDEENFQASHLLLDNKSSLENDSKNTKYFNLHLARKVFDSNKVQNKNTSAVLPVRSVGLNNMWFPITIPRLSFMNSTDILVADLKRVRKTLREAKEFSLELMRLLNMYENANKEFECVSDKLKLSYACLIGSDIKVKKQESGYIKETNQKQEKTYNRIENELHGRQSVPPSAELNVDLRINTIISDNNISKLKNARDYDITSQDVAHRRKQNRLEDEIELHLNSDEQFCNDMANVESVKQIEITESNKVKEDKQMEKVLTNDPFSRIKEISAGIDKDEKKNNQINKEDYKKYKRSKTRNSNGLKAKSFHHQIKYRVAVGTSTDNNSTSINRSKTKLLVNFSEKVDQRNNNAQEHCKDLKQIMKKIDSVFAGIEQITASTSTETKALDDHFNNTVISHEIKETSPWPILRKNFSWNARPQTTNEISNFQKQRTHSVSQQTATPRKRRHENKTLASLQVEVQKLLDMPRLESQQCYQSC
ncbi:hypothetical protein HF086_012378 [Spodoptera exigua]|uniref:Uncharacterized protein n=1 Tax=Spodoptera exigua TaxID=7107 RepID=A0A922M9N1_SPOEX|nr:hypothetical protein HF086_012378 [Spodoptera exigua]